MEWKGNRNEFIQKHKSEVLPLVNKEVADEIEYDMPLSASETSETLEKFETKVFKWNRSGALPDAKQILLEASEPAAYKTIKPLIQALQKDPQCAGITLVTDDVSGKQFEEEQDTFKFTRIQDEGKPIVSDVLTASERPFDAVFALGEPKNSPDKMLLFSGRSVFGTEKTRLYYMLDGLNPGSARFLFEAYGTSMDSIDQVFVAVPLAKEIVEKSIPQLKGKVTVVGSLMLAMSKEKLVASRDPQMQKALKDRLGIGPDATTILFSGFPSTDAEGVGGSAVVETATGEKRLQQEVFNKTFSAIAAAAAHDPARRYALIIREHPRAKNVETLQVPSEFPANLFVAHADGPVYDYDAVAGASDIIVCLSGSTEVFLAPYRGSVAALPGYAGRGMIRELDERTFGGEGAAALRESPEVLYIDSEETFTRYLEGFEGRPKPRELPEDPTARIADILLKGSRS